MKKILILTFLALSSNSHSAVYKLNCANLKIILNDDTLKTSIETDNSIAISHAKLMINKIPSTPVETFYSSNGIILDRVARLIDITQTGANGRVIIPRTRCQVLSVE